VNYVIFFIFYVTKNEILGSYFRNYSNMYSSRKKGITKANKINPFQSKENRINLLLKTFYEK